MRRKKTTKSSMNLDDEAREAIAKVIALSPSASTQVGAIRGAMYRYAKLLEWQVAAEARGGRLEILEIAAADGAPCRRETLDLKV